MLLYLLQTKSICKFSLNVSSLAEMRNKNDNVHKDTILRNDCMIIYSKRKSVNIKLVNSKDPPASTTWSAWTYSAWPFSKDSPSRELLAQR